MPEFLQKSEFALITANGSIVYSSPNSLLSVITKTENYVFCEVHSLL